MKVKIKRIDKDLPLPEYKTSGSVAFDLLVREGCLVNPGAAAILPMNIIVAIPQGFMLAVVPRSSLFRKKGLIPPNGFGIIDQDYHGSEDEIGLYVYNITDQPVEVKRGERLGQAVFVRVDKAEWEEVEGEIREGSRGGFGSTG